MDALTGDPINLTLTPNGVVSVSPAATVMSFREPEGTFTPDVVASFRHFVNFFTSRMNAQQWTADHPGTFVLDLSDAFELGVRYADAITGAHR